VTAKVSSSPSTTGIPALFSAEGAKLGLTAQQLQHLLSLSRRSPGQLAEPTRDLGQSGTATPPREAPLSDLLDGDPLSSSAPAQGVPEPTDPTIAALLRFTAAQMSQQAKMLDLLVADQKKEASLEDLLTTSGSGNASGSSSSERL